jgi:hypothetical protein
VEQLLSEMILISGTGAVLAGAVFAWTPSVVFLFIVLWWDWLLRRQGWVRDHRAAAHGRAKGNAPARRSSPASARGALARRCRLSAGHQGREQ